MKPIAVDVPQPGQLCQLADDLYWARFELPFRLNHINLYILDTEQGWCIIDAGVNSPATAEQWKHLLNGPLNHQPVSRLIVTHHHVDHIGYAGELGRMFNIPMEMTALEAEHACWLYALSDAEYGRIAAQHYHNFGCDEEHIIAAAQDGSRFRRHAAPFAEMKIISATTQIRTRYGVWQLRTDRGHSDDHISLMDTQRGLFIGVDYLLPRISPNISADIRYPDDDLLTAYLTYLEDMQHLDDRVQVFPGHDWPFMQAASRAEQLIHHHHHRLDQLCAAAKGQDITTQDGMDILFERKFSGHELYFASGEARAHLNYLVAHHKMAKIATPNQADRFRLI